MSPLTQPFFYKMGEGREMFRALCFFPSPTCGRGSGVRVIICHFFKYVTYRFIKNYTTEDKYNLIYPVILSKKHILQKSIGKYYKEEKERLFFLKYCCYNRNIISTP